MSERLWVVKVGGNVVDDPATLTEVVEALAAAREPWLLVHGGGKLATELADRLGLPTQMIEGRRVTGADTLRIATMVYAGWLNKTLVARLQAVGVDALGLSGADADAIRARRRSPDPIDYGYVGDPTEVRAEFFYALLSAGHRPVVAPITHDGAGQLLNTNADTVAQAVAVSLAGVASPSARVELVYCFDRPGVLSDPVDLDSVISQISAPDFERLKAEGVVSGGMLPKLNNAFAAIAQGVASVRLLDARGLSLVLTGGKAGTTLVA